MNIREVFCITYPTKVIEYIERIVTPIVSGVSNLSDIDGVGQKQTLKNLLIGLGFSDLELVGHGYRANLGAVLPIDKAFNDGVGFEYQRTVMQEILERTYPIELIEYVCKLNDNPYKKIPVPYCPSRLRDIITQREYIILLVELLHLIGFPDDDIEFCSYTPLGRLVCSVKPLMPPKITNNGDNNNARV